MDLKQQNIAWFNYAGSFKGGNTGDWSLAAFSILAQIAEATENSEPAARVGTVPNATDTVRIPWWAVRIIAHRWRSLIESHRTAGKDEFALSLDSAFGFRKTAKGARPRVRQFIVESDEIHFAIAVAKGLGANIHQPARGAVKKCIEDVAKARNWGIERGAKAWKRHRARILRQLERWLLPENGVRR